MSKRPFLVVALLVIIAIFVPWKQILVSAWSTQVADFVQYGWSDQTPESIRLYVPGLKEINVFDDKDSAYQYLVSKYGPAQKVRFICSWINGDSGVIKMTVADLPVVRCNFGTLVIYNFELK